jgi:hypothetical protein
MTSEITIDASHVTVKLPDDHDPKQPFPLTIRRDFENPNCWATGDGKRVFGDRYWAAKAMELDTPEYKERSRLRMEHSRLIKAEAVDWTGWVYSDEAGGYNEGYFEDVGALREHCECEGIPVPAYCWGTREDSFDFDIFDALDNYLNDNHHEEAHDQIEGWDELEVFWKSWAAKQTLKSYYVDMTKVVVIDPAGYATAIEAAKAFLAALEAAS